MLGCACEMHRCTVPLDHERRRVKVDDESPSTFPRSGAARVARFGPGPGGDSSRGAVEQQRHRGPERHRRPHRTGPCGADCPAPAAGHAADFQFLRHRQIATARAGQKGAAQTQADRNRQRQPGTGTRCRVHTGSTTDHSSPCAFCPGLRRDARSGYPNAPRPGRDDRGCADASADSRSGETRDTAAPRGRGQARGEPHCLARTGGSRGRCKPDAHAAVDSGQHAVGRGGAQRPAGSGRARTFCAA